jgi:hypothetical protein
LDQDVSEGSDDLEDHWLEEHAEFVLALHDGWCVAEAIQDAIAHGIDDDYGARQGAAQLLEAGDISCRCANAV